MADCDPTAIHGILDRVTLTRLARELLPHPPKISSGRCGIRWSPSRRARAAQHKIDVARAIELAAKVVQTAAC